MGALQSSLHRMLVQEASPQDAADVDALADAWHELTMAVACGRLTLPPQVVGKLFVDP